LESDAADSTSPSTVEAKPKSSLKIAAIALGVIAVVVSALLVGILFLKPSGQSAWLFKGAYAKYEGSASASFVTFSFTMRQEVVDFNSTHVKLLMSANLDSSMNTPIENETAMWVPLSNNVYTVESGTLINSYEAKNMYFTGIGNRDCIVYEYTTDGPTMTIYIDKAIGWPLQMKLSMAGEESVSLELEINLVETNIPGLK
jgi:hypothetical protein